MGGLHGEPNRGFESRQSRLRNAQNRFVLRQDVDAFLHGGVAQSCFKGHRFLGRGRIGGSTEGENGLTLAGRNRRWDFTAPLLLAISSLVAPAAWTESSCIWQCVSSPAYTVRGLQSSRVSVAAEEYPTAASERSSVLRATALPVVKSSVMLCGAARPVAVMVPPAPEMVMPLPVPETAYVLATEITLEVMLEESPTLATATTPAPMLFVFIPTAMHSYEPVREVQVSVLPAAVSAGPAVMVTEVKAEVE